ncbi:hypothetical protein NFI96_029248 [Prochilodus magdalenae]|nr:hypothetical protein NFI96_029248 [Prochilodus magdalenae]
MSSESGGLDFGASLDLVCTYTSDKMNPEKWMQSVEGKLVLGSSSDTFFEGLAALFAIYYTLNLEYQEGAASAMEFIQRC